MTTRRPRGRGRVRHGQYAGHMKPGERVAVVDLGSNSFRLVVFMAGDGWWRRTDEIYEPVRIGEGLAASGELGERPIARALATLEVFAHFCRASGLDEDHVDAVATSAIRDARNAEAFLTPARERFPGAIRVLSREQEAYYAYLAAVNSTTLRGGLRARSRRRLAAAAAGRGPTAAPVRLLAGGDRADERALPPGQRPPEAQAAGGTAPPHRHASCPRPGGSRGWGATAVAWSASGARCATSPRRPSGRLGCPPPGSRGW